MASTILMLITILVLVAYAYDKRAACEAKKTETQVNLFETDLYADLKLKEAIKIYEPNKPVHNW